MTKRRVITASAAGAVTLLVGLALRTATSAGAAPERPVTKGEGRVPVLVELFTSEGCSSCPPADEVLAHLERAQPVSGAYVVPLAFHVDYWDSLGWKDPFSSWVWSSRQQGYASLGRGTYTPQAVVDGAAELVGSDSSALERAVGHAAARSHATVDVSIVAEGDAFDISVHAGAIPGSLRSDAEVLVALTEAQARIPIPRGENSGRTLIHTAIVRDLRVVGTVGQQGGQVRATIRPSPDLARRELRVVAWVQDRNQRTILGAATRPLRKESS